MTDRPSYFAFHPAGLGAPVRAALGQDLPGTRVAAADDSALVLQSAAEPSAIAGLPYLGNVFEIVGRSRRRGVDRTARDLAIGLERAGPRPRSGGFRVMLHADGHLERLDPGARSALERAIAGTVGGRVEARGRGTDYWMITRRGDPDAYLGRRLAGSAAQRPAAGELSPEIAHLIARVAGSGPDDVVLDPFGGSGAILRARGERPSRRLIYSDLDRTSFAARLGWLHRDPANLVLEEDARSLPSVPTASVSHILTDPPWGEHAAVEGGYEPFAAATWSSFDRVLDPVAGRVTMLVGRRRCEAMAHAATASRFAIDASFDLLVHGHPATLLVARRRAPRIA